MAYIYDAFFSYKRDEESNDWHKRVKDKIKFWLDNELNKDCDIFFDTEDISTGSRWKSKISSALLKSRCIICVWSPMYFQSEWCVAEWLTFEERCKALDAELILPARYHDGEYYPDAANDRQIFDFRKYASIMPVFWETHDAYEFEKEVIKPFVVEVANAIRNAPDFSDEFPIVDKPTAAQVMQRPKIARLIDD